jgi:peptide deformylase
MAVLSILTAPDARLKEPARPVERIDERVLALVDAMLETMYDAPGIGLAAPQVGVGLRVFVADVSAKEEPPSPLVLINPAIVWRSEELVVAEEGCLSLPEHYGEVTRPAEVVMRHRDREGSLREIRAAGLLARCLQHEQDHLDGILFIDHLSMLRRNMILRKLAKARRQSRA